MGASAEWWEGLVETLRSDSERNTERARSKVARVATQEHMLVRRLARYVRERRRAIEAGTERVWAGDGGHISRLIQRRVRATWAVHEA